MFVRWTVSAQSELDRQIDYIADDNLSAAYRLRDIVLRHTEMLSETPGIGRTGRTATSRELVIAGTPFIAIYRVRPKSVDIVKFIHTAQRYP